jgi:hypothetical protein
MTTSELLTPDSIRWAGFWNLLIAALAGTGDDISDTDLMRGCDNTLKQSEQILRAMGGIDVELTLDYFEDCGGHCVQRRERACSSVATVSGLRSDIRQQGPHVALAHRRCLVGTDAARRRLASIRPQG